MTANIVSALTLLTAQSNPQDQVLRSTVTSFASTVEIASGDPLVIRRTQSASTGRIHLTVIRGPQIFGLDPAGLHVVQFSDSNKPIGVNLPLTLDFYKAKALSYSTDLAYFAEAAQPRTSVSHITAATKNVTVRINEKVDGADTLGAGNRVSFVFSTVTGKLTAFSASVGYSYGPRQVILSESTAIEKAKILYRNSFGKSYTGTTRTHLGYAPLAKDFGTTTFETRRTNKRVYYAYIVQLGHTTIFVDSRDGSSLGGVTSTKQE